MEDGSDIGGRQMRHSLVLATFSALAAAALAGCDTIGGLSDKTGYFDEAMHRSEELQTELRHRLRHTQGEYSESGHQSDFRPKRK